MQTPRVNIRPLRKIYPATSRENYQRLRGSSKYFLKPKYKEDIFGLKIIECFEVYDRGAYLEWLDEKEEYLRSLGNSFLYSFASDALEEFTFSYNSEIKEQELLRLN